MMADGATTLGRVYRCDASASRVSRVASPTVLLADGNGDTGGGFLTRRAAHEVSEGSFVWLSNGSFGLVREVRDGFVTDNGARRPAVRLILGRIGDPPRVVYSLASAMVLVRIPKG
jgi:hypothetical protein